MSNNHNLFGLWPEEGLVGVWRRKRRAPSTLSTTSDEDVELGTLEQIADSQDDDDLIFEHVWNEDDETDSLDAPPSSPLHNSLQDLEAPDPEEIIQGTVEGDDEFDSDDEDDGRPKLWATALAVTAMVGLGVAKILESSGDLDELTDFDNSFTTSDGGGATAGKAGADASAATAGGEGAATEYGAAKASGDGVIAKGGDTVVAKATDGAAASKGSSDGIGGGGGKVAGNDTGAGGKAAGNDTGAGGKAAGNDTGAGGKAAGNDTGAGGNAAANDSGAGGNAAAGNDGGGGVAASGNDAGSGAAASGSAQQAPQQIQAPQ